MCHILIDLVEYLRKMLKFIRPICKVPLDVSASEFLNAD